MSDLILHHYPASPFAEKVRVLLGFKGLSYQSVTIPVIMPKPDLTALTGGYRKTPVLQIGNHIYCDTSLISRVLDERGSKPSIYPKGQEATANIMAAWADSQLFGCVVALVFSPQGLASKLPTDVLQALVKDRAAMREGSNVASTPLDVAQSHIPVCLSRFEEQLSSGGPYLLGETVSIADFSVYHCLWFIRSNLGASVTLKPYTKVIEWMDKMASLGHGNATELSSEAAVDIAHQADSKLIDMDGQNFLSESIGSKKGDSISVIPTDYGMDPVSGELIMATMDEIAVKREDPRAGSVVVHFPRMGYRIKAEG